VIDRSVAAGVVQAGSRWGRLKDEAGLGLVGSGLSDPHQYLAAGGYGFLIDAGALNYAPEVLRWRPSERVRALAAAAMRHSGHHEDA
jgi:hypothetical protein